MLPNIVKQLMNKLVNSIYTNLENKTKKQARNDLTGLHKLLKLKKYKIFKPKNRGE